MLKLVGAISTFFILMKQKVVSAFRDDMLPQPLYGIPDYSYRETTSTWKIGIRIVLFIATIVSCIIGVVIIAKKSKKWAIITSIILLIILSIILFLFGRLIFDI